MNAKTTTKQNNVENERDMVMFGLFNDGGNAYSSRNDEHWYWSVSDGETAAEFRKRLKRQGEHKAQTNYYEYIKGSYGVRVFKDINQFVKAANKVGLNPNLSEYEYLLEQQSK